MDRFTRNVSLMGLGLLVFLGVSIGMVMKGGLKGWEEANASDKKGVKGATPATAPMAAPGPVLGAQGVIETATTQAMPGDIEVTVYDDKGMAVEGAEVYGTTASTNTGKVLSDARGYCRVNGGGLPSIQRLEWVHASKAGVGSGLVKAEVGKPMQIVLTAGFAAETQGAGEGTAVGR